MSPYVLFLLLHELELGSQDVYTVTGMLDLTGILSIQVPGSNMLNARAWMTATQPRLRPESGEQVDFFDVIRSGDLIAHHPYVSFVTTVDAFVEQAARDKDVLAIKISMYRTSGPERPIARAPKGAAQS